MDCKLLFILPALLLAGCFGNGDNNGTDNLYDYKGITVPRDIIPSGCEGKIDCELFSCMVESCWCKSSPEAVPYDCAGTSDCLVQLTQEQDAAKYAEDYLKRNSVSYSGPRIVKLNGVFYNFFYNDGLNDEHVLTLAIDGTIMETVCGV